MAPLASVRVSTASTRGRDDATLQAIAGAVLLGLAAAGALTLTRTRRRLVA